MLALLLSLTLSLAQAQAPPEAAVLPLTGMFSTGSDALTPAGEEAMMAWLRLLQASPAVTFEIGVHSDSTGAGAHNQALTQRRADALRAALIGAGASPSQLVATGYGEERPVATNDSADGRTQNRRAELRPAGGRAASAGPQQWQGISLALRGALGSGDELRERGQQVERAGLEVPFSARAELYFFHSRDNDPAAQLVGPSGERVPLPLGQSRHDLAAGRWTVELRDQKRASGTWGLRLSAVSPAEAPGAGADACAVLSYIVAQAHVDMIGLRGAALDDSYDAAEPIPGLPGTARVHRRGELRQALYEGSSASSADAAWARGRQTLTRCLSDDWAATDTGWETMVMRAAPDQEGWQQRALVLDQRGAAPGVRVKLSQERWPDTQRTLLTVYLPSE